MTAPAPPTQADPAPREDNSFGECLLMVDQKKELVCGLPAVTEVLVRNDFGIYSVPLCRGHKSQHRSFYAALRARQNRPRRR